MNIKCLSRLDCEPQTSAPGAVTLAGLLGVAMVCLSLLMSGKANALEVPDFEQLVKDLSLIHI